MSVKVLGLCGSTRTGSLNERFLDYALGQCRTLGAEAERFDLRANRIPLFDADEEAASGHPESVRALKAAIAGADAIVFASPEYNAALTPLAKCIIDWASRGTKDGPNNVWSGKPIVLISASPGGFGGFRSLTGLRPIFVEVGALVLSEQCSLGRAHDAYTEEGTLKDARTEGFLKGAMEKLLDVAQRLK